MTCFCKLLSPLKCTVILTIFEYWHILTKFEFLSSAHLFSMYSWILCSNWGFENPTLANSETSGDYQSGGHCAVASFCQDRPKSILFPFSNDCLFPYSSDCFCQDQPKTFSSSQLIQQSQVFRNQCERRTISLEVSKWHADHLPPDSFLPRSAWNLHFTSNLSAVISRLNFYMTILSKSWERKKRTVRWRASSCRELFH